MINPAVFKAYDIRGLIGDEITPELAFALGKAIVLLLKERQLLEKVAVGYDMRDSSPELAEALMKGIRSQGINVLNIGLVTTPMLNFAVGSREDVQAGVMITASHNPAEYNGFKISDINVLPIGRNNGMDALKDFVFQEVARKKEAIEMQNFASFDNDEIETINLKNEYLDYVFSLVKLSDKKIKVAIDTANGIVGHIIKDVLDRLLNIEVIPMYWELDGNFPNHEANPLKSETLDALREKVLSENCDLGVAFDGDGDRVGFVDNEGEIISGDLVTALLAKVILKDNLGATVLYDLRSSNITGEIIQENGGVAEECPVGHAFIKALMRDKKAIFAGELSSHFYFSDFYNVESAVLAFLRILELLMLENKSIASLVQPLRQYQQSGEMNIKVSKEKEQEIYNELVNYFQTQSSDKAERISYLDGLKLSMPNWWFNLRFSNTEPLLRINIEAKDENILHDKKNELFSLLNKYF